MLGDSLDAVLDVPEVSAASIQASVEGAPVYGNIAAHGEAHGDLSKLATTLHATFGPGSLDVVGEVAAKGALAAHATLALKDFDARTFVEGGPATDLGAHIVAAVETRADKALVAHASIETPVGSVSGQVIPHTTLHADMVQSHPREAPPVVTWARRRAR